jgi:hypothetical protein
MLHARDGNITCVEIVLPHVLDMGEAFFSGRFGLDVMALFGLLS